MNWLQRRILGKKNLELIEKAAAIGSGRMEFVGGQVVWMSDNGQGYIKEAYQANDIIFSAANLIADKVRMAPWGLYEVVDESSLKQANAILSGKYDAKGYMQAQRLRRKSLQPIENMNSRVGKLADLMKWCNDYDTFNDVVATATLYQLITGNEMLYAVLLDKGANTGVPNELYNMPAQYMSIVAKTSFPQKVLGWQLNAGTLDKFTVEEIMHIRFANLDYDMNGSGLYGMSPVRAAANTVTRNNAAKLAGASQLQNNGATGLAYIDDDKISSEQAKAQAKAIKEVWNQEYTGAKNFNKVAFAGARMGYVQVGMSLKDMGLTDIEAVDLRRLANIWGIPSQLLNDPDNKTYNNQKEAEKALTARCAMPRLRAFRDNLNRKLQTHWGYKGMNVYVDFDASVYPELNEDMSDMVKWMNELVMPEAYKLEMAGIEVPANLPEDLILVDQNKVPLTELLNNMSDAEMAQINEQLNKAGLKY